MLQWLLDKGSEPDLTNAKGDTPLHLSFKCGNIKCIVELVKSGASMNIVNKKGITPLGMGKGSVLAQLNLMDGCAIRKGEGVRSRQNVRPGLMGRAGRIDNHTFFQSKAPVTGFEPEMLVAAIRPPQPINPYIIPSILDEEPGF
jgi:hypothetical protein